MALFACLPSPLPDTLPDLNLRDSVTTLSLLSDSESHFHLMASLEPSFVSEFLLKTGSTWSTDLLVPTM